MWILYLKKSFFLQKKKSQFYFFMLGKINDYNTLQLHTKLPFKFNIERHHEKTKLFSCCEKIIVT